MSANQKPKIKEEKRGFEGENIRNPDFISINTGIQRAGSEGVYPVRDHLDLETLYHSCKRPRVACSQTILFQSITHLRRRVGNSNFLSQFNGILFKLRGVFFPNLSFFHASSSLWYFVT